jgi:nucleolar protein 12
MLPRKLRVSRAKGIKRNVAKQNTWSRPATNGVYNPKINDQQKSAMGRASKLLGRAGAAMINQSGTSIPKLPAKASDLKAPESFVFEGHRATRGSGSVGKKVSAKTKGRPDNRSSRRAKEWKFGGGGDK